MKNKDEEKTLEMNIYIAGKTTYVESINRDCLGMYTLEYDGTFLNMTRCELKDFSKYIISSLSCNIKPKLVDKVVINYPDKKFNMVFYLDGFFGRPHIFHKIQELKPLTKKERKSLSEEINKINNFEAKGKIIKLISN